MLPSARGQSTQRGNPGAPTAKGFIGIDAYDGTTGADVWHGVAFAEIDPQQIDEALLAQGVAHLFTDFPARAGATAAEQATTQ